MKAMMKIPGTLLICLLASVAFAGITPEVAITESGGMTFMFHLENPEGKALNVCLKDKDGLVLQNDWFREKETVSQKYNLSELPAGEYTLLITEGATTIVQPIHVEEEQVSVPHDMRAEFFAPAVVLNDNKLDFTMLSVEETRVKIEIIDDSGRVNYSASANEKGSIQRRFDVSALDPGQYRLVTTIEAPNFETTYSDSFRISDVFAGN